MRFQSALELKRRVVSEELNIEQSVLGTDTQRGMGIHSIEQIPRVENRLAAGISKVGVDNYKLELRVQKKVGSAYRKAEKWKEEANGEANIVVVEEIRIPHLIKFKKQKP